MSRSMQKPIWPRLPSTFVKGQLLAHKLLGLTLAALMYLVCLSGAIAVFYADFERWERPAVPEMTYASPETVGRSIAFARQDAARSGAEPTDVFITTPNAEMPRLVVDYEGATTAFDAAGQPAGSAAHDLTHFLVGLHYALNLPWQIGFIVIGILGVLLVALIVGGSLALPRMFRDAFTLRLDGGRRLSRVDIHNRLAVWGLPFHLIVAITGAIMGVALIALAIAAPIQFGSDSARASAMVYGDPATIAAEARAAGTGAELAPDARIVAALETLARERPDNPPLYIALNQFGTADETVSIGAGHNDTLIYGETYRFDTAGRLMGADGNADGDLGRQVYASMFRLHAGAFGGLWVKLVYAALGLALSFICTTGVDIWLAKAAAQGRAYPRLQAVWTSFVWGAPAMLAAASSAYMLTEFSPIVTFWTGLPLVSLAGVWAPQRIVHWAAPLAAGVLVFTLPLIHVLRFGEAAFTPASASVNAAFGLTALALVALALRNATRAASPKTSQHEAPAAV